MQSRDSLSVIIPTKNRADRLVRTLESLANQAAAPEEVIVVVASDDPNESDQLAIRFEGRFESFSAIRASQVGAAAQRNQGFDQASGCLIGYCDDDVDFQSNYIAVLRLFLTEHSEFVGVAATVVNQAPRSIGRITRFVLKQLDDKRPLDFGGRVVGPGLNLYPVFDPAGTTFRETEWLNLGATLYRKSSLPIPPFPSVFRGYSFCEDLALSCAMAREGKLAVLRDARIFHDSQPGKQKCGERALGRMEVNNRFYVATSVLGRNAGKSWWQLLCWQFFCFIANLRRMRLIPAATRAIGNSEALIRLGVDCLTAKNR